MGHRHMHRMTPPASQALALEANAACARLALGCAYSTSEEFEAELISARRAAGMYGACRPWQAMGAFVTAALAFVAFLYLTH